MSTPAMTAPSSAAAADMQHDLSARIRMLIKLEGSASAIARRCGISEGTVRNWRDGHHDISRERCVILARALGVSLRWLVAGEGTMRNDACLVSDASTQDSMEMHPGRTASAFAASHASVVNTQLLAAAMRLLQSYVGLAGGSLAPEQRASAIATLYELLACAGEPGHADRMLAFHTALKEQLRSRRDALVA